MAQTLGIIDIEWRGVKIAVEKGASLELGGLMQKEVIAGRQVHFANEMTASKVTAMFPLRRGDSLLAIWAPGQGPLQVLCDTGQTYAWDDAFLTNRPKATSGDGGKVEGIWAGGEPSELIS